MNHSKKDLSISKSKYIVGLRSLKELWANYHAKEMLPEVDAQTQLIFDQGHKVGNLAKELFPGGIDLDSIRNFNETIEATKDAVKHRKPIYEATFAEDRMYARADILVPSGTDEWDLYEVKSSTGVKEDYLQDVAFQNVCYKAAGIKINKSFVIHVDSSYVFFEPLDIDQFFAIVDVTNEIKAYEEIVRLRLPRMLEVIDSEEMPADMPELITDCPICSAEIPENSVFELVKINKHKAQEWYLSGIKNLDEFDRDNDLSKNQRIQLESYRSKEEHIDRDKINSFLDKLEYPLYFLDFETFGLGNAIPFIENSRPYQHIPFQYSLHIQREPSAPIEHKEYLHQEAGTDPRQEFMEKLKEDIGEEGSIIAWSMGYEKQILRKVMSDLQIDNQFFNDLQTRFVDLMQPFQQFSLYHPSQKGSYSLKYVLPAFTELRYSDLDIADGGTAAIEYLKAFKGELAEDESARVYNDLLKYCELDTYAMVELLEVLWGKVIMLTS